MNSKRIWAIALLIVAVGAVAAIGIGIGTAITPPPLPDPTFTYGAHTLTRQEQDMLKALNAYRTANGMPAWKQSAPLNAAAYAHSGVMAKALAISDPDGEWINNYTHTNTRAYQSFVAVGPDNAYTINMWKTDPNIQPGLLDDMTTEVGVACVKARYPDKVTGYFWTLIASSPAGTNDTKAYLQPSIMGTDESGSPSPIPVGSPSPVKVWWGD